MLLFRRNASFSLLAISRGYDAGIMYHANGSGFSRRRQTSNNPTGLLCTVVFKEHVYEVRNVQLFNESAKMINKWKCPISTGQ